MTARHITVYQTSCSTPDDDNFIACMAILRWCGIPKEVIVDRRQAMIHSAGSANPASGFAMVDSEGKSIRNWYYLAKWIDDNAFRPMV